MIESLNRIKRTGLRMLPVLMLAGIPGLLCAQTEKSPLSVDKSGKLVYASDERGNRIPDFSYSGYMAGEKPIPDVPVRVVVPVKSGDAAKRIQAALDYVSSLPPDSEGIRGAVLLEKGTYEISGSLLINTSGVILRGSGIGEDGTILYGAGKDRETLIRIAGKNDRRTEPAVKITDTYVPVNAMQIQVAAPDQFKAGDKILIHRPSVKKWIDTLQTAHFGGGITYLGWKPGERDIYWDRTITAVKGSVLLFDAPVTTALDTAFGGGSVTKYSWQGRISQTGLENLRLISAYDKENLKDEAHRWMAVTIENAADAWVRQVVFQHFAGSAVNVQETAKRITVEDCKSLAPVSEIGGQRRYTFFTSGQQVLFQRIYAEYGYHDFAVGFCAPGPNAFVQCESQLPYSFSGTIDSWASGVLFDVVNVDGNALRFGNRGQDNVGAGWSAANSVFWQCSAARIDCYKPPAAQNWAFGCWAQFSGNGYWESSNEHIRPRSLYYAQLRDRLGNKVLSRAFLLDIGTEASSSPSVEKAAELTALAQNPPVTLAQWINSASDRNPIPTAGRNVKTIEQTGYKDKTEKVKLSDPMQVQNGWLVRGDKIVTGSRHQVPWWSGTVQPADLKKAKPAVTRFVPGRIGNGLTDDLNEVTDWMKQMHIAALEQNYGLWYDRRRDDHERIRRMDGEVWPPFYELPFARSGEGTAWDGLSKYDLTKYNTWYWHRLKQFADLADQKGLVLVHHNYFQHNIIEAGAHYADFPWRTANNINDTGFPEPVPYAGDKRIFLAEQFYDISNPVRRELHRKYIRQCLNNFIGNTGVIQFISAEYTGPLHFVEFWLDVVKEWEQENNTKVIVGLSTTKDVQDAVLADPARSKTVNLIDIRYWHYQADGSAYAPKGGQNLAPRQHARLMKPKKTSFEQVYRAVSEYRLKYPDKAVMYSSDNLDAFAWAAFMAGGSLASVPQGLPAGFLKAASVMAPVNPEGKPEGQWTLKDNKGSYIIYNASSAPVIPDAKNLSGRTVQWINPANGRVLKEEKLKGGKIEKYSRNAEIIWIKNK